MSQANAPDHSRDEPEARTVRVLRAGALPAGNLFATPIVGSWVTPFGVIDLGSPRLKLALATTEGGEVFPAQYHTGGWEMAVILAGAGAIEVLGASAHCVTCERGDVVLIPPDIVYQVRNRRRTEPLIAWLFFVEEAQVFWPDGRPA